MEFTAIHQFSLAMSTGDGVSNSVFFCQKLLKQLGYHSNIYSVDSKKLLSGVVYDYKDYCPDANQLLLVHHAYGHGFGAWLESLPDTKALVYHNISPPEYFTATNIQNDLLLGRQQLSDWKEFLTAAIADSDFNRNELLDAGWNPNIVKTIPLLVDIQSIKNKSFDSEIIKKNKEICTILFVGQLLPHKSQGDLIRCFYYLKQLITDQPMQMILAGGGDAHVHLELSQLIHQMGLDGHIHLLGKISDKELFAWYRVADLYVSMSEHEGFGMPLVEANVFDIPVVAYEIAGVADTMGIGSLLFKEKDFIRVAALLSLLLQDGELRQRVMQGQRDNLIRFDRELLLNDLQTFIGYCAFSDSVIN